MVQDLPVASWGNAVSHRAPQARGLEAGQVFGEAAAPSRFVGALCLGIGMLRVSRGTLYVVNFYSMQAFSGAIVAIDSIAVLVALFPVS